MALADNLLTPIPGPNPSGSYLRYEGAYDRIKEARRADDELDKGDYKRPGPPKISEYEQVRKAAESALANQSKDLQIAAWLTEALIYRAGFAGLRDGLELCRGLLERFWDTLYPEIDDGDLEFRLAPLEWVATKLDFAIQSVPLARGGLGWFKYKESRAVGYETDTAGNDKKLERRLSAIADKKITAEAFDRAVKETSVEALQQTASDLAGAIDATNALEAACRQKFGNAAPGFGPARELLQEIRHRVGSFVDGRSEAETKAVAAVEEVPPVNGFPSVPLALSREIAPAESGGAAESIVAIAAAMRRDNPASPIPYLLLRALRWGELRAAGTDLDGIPLEPPSTEIRMRLRSLFTEGDWENLIEAAENAMSQPCGCAWLDLQRYVVKACAELGGSYDAVAAALRSELKALLADYPQLPETNLRDDTPAANPDTKAWLNELIPPDRPARPPSPEPPTFV
ncbi:MAG: type VI secretion system protein TssA, partial [Acidobacteriota bacterium]|nr:type VI secretion system protein TssA [Acidobacteriota bacterium]